MIGRAIGWAKSIFRQQRDREIWRPVIGFEGLYEVSNYGRVRSLLMRTFKKEIRNRQVPRILRWYFALRRPPEVSLRREMKTIKCSIARLVLEAFIGPRPPGYEAAWVGDKENPRLTSFKWLSPEEAAAAKAERLAGAGWKNQCGERNHRAKCTTEKVRLIRAARANGASYDAIAARFGISRCMAQDIVHRRTWKHVD